MKRHSTYPLRLPHSIKAEVERHATRRQAIREAQAIVAPDVPRGRALVAELIAERREEAAREQNSNVTF